MALRFFLLIETYEYVQKISGGTDGARTRDPLRDRQVF